MKGLTIGQQATVTHRFTPQEIAAFHRLAGSSGEAGTVPGPLIGGLFSYLLGTALPGRGTNYLKQSLHFPGPAPVGEELTATVEIIRLRPDKELVNLRTTCTSASGAVICEGEALVLVRDLEAAPRAPV